jgi:phosphate starvation-inducible PhoH-like protein
VGEDIGVGAGAGAAASGKIEGLGEEEADILLNYTRYFYTKIAAPPAAGRRQKYTSIVKMDATDLFGVGGIGDFREPIKIRGRKKRCIITEQHVTVQDNIGRCPSPPSLSSHHAPPTPPKNRRKQKKQNQKQLISEMFDFNTGPAPPLSDVSHASASAVSSSTTAAGVSRAEIDAKFSKPKNKSQELYQRTLNDKTKKIVIATGPAGTGKTLFATEYAVRHFKYGNVEKLIFTRPSVAVDEDIGYLPGTAEEKISHYVRPIYDILYRHYSPREVTAMLEEKVIEIVPLGFMRGRTFQHCCIIADEMQNSTVAQMKMILTRIGENSRIFITGDLEQHDRRGEKNGLEDFLGKFKGRRSTSIDSIEFDKNDIQREEVIKEVLDIYSGDTVVDYYSPV